MIDSIDRTALSKESRKYFYAGVFNMPFDK